MQTRWFTLPIKQRIELLDFHSFYDVRWLIKTVLPWMKTLQTAAITDHNRGQFCREKSLQTAKQKHMAWR